MPLTVLCSLALMLLLFSTILHLVSLILPAWVTLGVFVPVSFTHRAEAAGAGGGGAGGLETLGNVTSVTTASPEPVVDLRGPKLFVDVRLGLWEWCQQFRPISPDCVEPGFLGGAQLLAVLTLATLPISFFLLTYTSCLPVDGNTRRRLFTRLALIGSASSGLLLLLLLAMYGVLTTREVDAMLREIRQQKTSGTYLGWAFGAEGVTCVLAWVASLCLALHLRRSPKPAPEFQLVG